ncbi:sigma factor-like helix-turn-helix DNA-binding protein [Microvirga lotononidis]|uniref:sigma factor-like helix-turn-helix DNA-binding protein n=1 Tax=Microvirga lotononidis TaxID=864069 RepID=UPI0038991996
MPEQLDELELQDLLQALSKLPAWQREVLLLVGVEGLSYEEIAARQHVTVGTVNSRVNRVRHHLAQILSLGPDDAIGSRFSHPERADAEAQRACITSVDLGAKASHERACSPVLGGPSDHSRSGPGRRARPTGSGSAGLCEGRGSSHHRATLLA